jgi:hypothetical protein
MRAFGYGHAGSGIKQFIGALLLAGGMGIGHAAVAIPINASFLGNFSADDDIQLFDFTTDGAAVSLIVSYGYAGGTNAAGALLGPGGFDTLLTLFNGTTGAAIERNDDGSQLCFDVADSLGPGIESGNVDPGTGDRFDACSIQLLAAGSYTVAITQYSNDVLNNNLANGFENAGQENFTSAFGCANGMFCDVNASNRSSAWAIDFMNVTSVARRPQVPVSQTSALFGLALLGMILTLRKRDKARK